jgi:homoserine kinase
VSRRVVVRVPASTANLGAGFDCVGVAVDRWLSVSVSEEISSSIVVQRAGTVWALDVTPDNDRVVLGFFAACAAAGRSYIGGLLIRESSKVPVARGLGSSAAATVAGAVAANALLRLGLTDLELATVCAQVEGHPDNVAAAIWGGAQLVLSGERLRVSALRVHPSIALVFSVPNILVETAYARSVLPSEVPHSVAARAAALGGALVHGLATASAELLASALEDVLHVPFRKGLVRAYQEIIDAACRAGAYGATLSGSGSSIVALAPVPLAQGVSLAMQTAWLDHDVVAESFVSARQVAGCSSTLYQDCEKDSVVEPLAQKRNSTCQ